MSYKKPVEYSSFNTQEFFQAALNRTYGDSPAAKYSTSHNYSKSYKNNNYRRFRKNNDYSRYSYAGDIYPQRQDLPSALRTSIYHNKYDNGSTMKKYYKHSLRMANNPNYEHLNKDDLAHALKLDIKRRGSQALDDYYEYERSLPHNVRNGKWHGGKFGHSTNSY